MRDFASRVVRWQKQHGRHDLPWQGTRDAYRVWLSEVMLQQTQVATATPYYHRFLNRFPDIDTLARATQEDVLQFWSGLGYYSRARNLHRAAGEISQRFNGRFPQAFDDVVSLPGIGRSTAGAICVFSHGQRHPILDGNVKRVFARCFGIGGYPGEKAVADRLWRKAEELLPQRDVEAYTQGLMDLGAGVCTRSRPSCGGCPLQSICVAFSNDAIADYPGRKPRKRLPQRHTIMMVLERAGQVLLEKRPPVGVWGGLWCFPEVEHAADMAPVCEHRYGARVRHAGVLPAIDHGFTHFRLRIEPRRLRVTRWSSGAFDAATQHRWLAIGDVADAAVPVPVRQIAASLLDDAG